MDWSNSEAWANDLAAELKSRASVYEQEGDVLLKRNKAANILATIAHALLGVPGVKESGAKFVLKDMLIMFADLENGRRHPWSVPSNTRGTNIDSVSETEVRAWALMALLALIDSGLAVTKADQIVAGHLKKSGRPRSPQTVKKWRRTLAKDADRRLTLVEVLRGKHWLPLRCDHRGTILDCPANNGGKCPDIPSVALRFATWAITSPTFRDGFASGR